MSEQRRDKSAIFCADYRLWVDYRLWIPWPLRLNDDDGHMYQWTQWCYMSNDNDWLCVFYCTDY